MKIKETKKPKEAAGSAERLPVVIISQGLGNLADRNYYTKEAIESGPAVYEGKKAYLDHPTETEQKEQPGRSTEDTAGHYEDVKAVQGKNGLMELQAYFVPEARKDVVDKIQHALDYKKRYPDKDYIAISINGDGEGEEMDYDDFLKTVKPSSMEMQKIKQVEGLPIYVIRKFTDAVSADLVTEAGARGRFLSEQAKKQKRKESLMKVSEALKNLFSAIGLGDEKLIEKAAGDIKGQLEDEDEGKKKEAEKNEKKEAMVVKNFLAAKKEMKKKEDESEEAYQARCMKQAMKQAEDEMKKEKKKEDDSGSDGDANGDDGDADDKKAKAKKDKEKKKEAKKEDEDEASESAESEDEDEKKEKSKKEKAKKEAKAKKEDEDEAEESVEADESEEGEGDPKKMMAKMKKEIASLKKENEALKKENEDAKESEKGHHKESATAKIKEQERARLVEMEEMLQESNLPRRSTKVLRPLLMKCKDVKEMKAFVEAAKESYQAVLDEELIVQSTGGFPAKQVSENSDTNDDLF